MGKYVHARSIHTNNIEGNSITKIGSMKNVFHSISFFHANTLKIGRMINAVILVNKSLKINSRAN